MAKNKLHPKFIPEKTCLWCDCTFLPSAKSSDEYCEDCTKMGYKLPDNGKKPEEKREYLYRKLDIQPVITPEPSFSTSVGTIQYKSKKCKKCGNDFIPNAPAQKWCINCKGNK